MRFPSNRSSNNKHISVKMWQLLKRALWFLSYLNPLYFWFIQLRYKLIIKQKRKKSKITVVFIIFHEAVWKLEGVYRLMEKYERFEPIIAVCPYTEYGEITQFNEMNRTFKAFIDKGYNVIYTYNWVRREWLDINKELKPDIMFFSVPHLITRKEYYITNFLKTITCYVPYTYQTTSNYQLMYNRTFHQVLWKAFYQTNIHLRIAVQFSQNKGKNVVVTGYPGIDRFLNLTPSDEETQVSKTKKSIIWAPHHTIEGEGYNLNFSNFLRYHKFMIELVKRYHDRIYFTFKPHPMLRPKLEKAEIWGKDNTDKYFKFWEQNAYCALNEGDYYKLFKESDALIHDCDSFMGEYLSLDKPVLYTIHDSHFKERLNEFGKSANDMHYHAGDEKGIIEFINEVVIKGKDHMKNLRSEWVKKTLISPNAKSASLNIFNYLKEVLNPD